jgi:hypothetical protein
MSDSFPDYDQIVIKPNDFKVEYTFDFPVCTDITSNDGFLPANTTLTSVECSGATEEGVTDNTLIAETPTLLDNVVTVSMKYPDSGAGRYSLTFKLYEGTTTYHANFESIFVYDE